MVRMTREEMSGTMRSITGAQDLGLVLGKNISQVGDEMTADKNE